MSNGSAAQEPECTPRILLVEDERVVALATEQLLRHHGYDPVHVSTGEEAIAALSRDPAISLVLMDIDLGAGIDGTEAARRILRARDLPIVFLTAHGEREMVERVKDVTRYGYVLKTAGEFVLLETIGMALELFSTYTERRRIARTVEERRRYLQGVLDCAPDAIITLDTEHRIVEWNRGAAELFGYSDQEVVGHELDQLVTRGADTAYQDARGITKRVLSHQEIPPTEAVRYTKTGDPVDVMLSGAPIILNEELVGIVAAYRDISRQKAAEREADRLLKEQEVLLKEIRHWAKNDIGLIRSFLNLQAIDSEATEVRAALQEAEARVAAVGRFYENLRSGEDFHTTSLVPVVRDLVEDLRSELTAHRISLQLTIGDEIHVPTRTAMHTCIIINELVTNVAKHAFAAAPGTAHVEVHQSSPGVLRITSADDGAGLPAEVAAGRRFGLGLTLITALAEQNNGEVTLSNDAGASVSVTLGLPDA
jgi:PAS domain S-box-containing protein